MEKEIKEGEGEGEVYGEGEEEGKKKPRLVSISPPPMVKRRHFGYTIN